jgi:hypothetical protein
MKRGFDGIDTLKSARGSGRKRKRGGDPAGNPRLGSTRKAHERSPAEVWGEAGRSSSKGGNNQERSDPSAA